jgi:sarcosine oxidase subunit gamma
MTPGRHGVLAGPAGVIVSRRVVVDAATVIVRPNWSGALMDRMASRFGLALADGPSVSSAPGLDLIGIGPGKWLALTGAGGPSPAEIARDLDGAAAVIPQTGSYEVMRLSGPRVLDMLAKCVPLDLASFKVGDAATTLAHHLGVTIWKTDNAPAFDLAVFRSMAGSAWHMIETAGAEFGVDVVG